MSGTTVGTTVPVHIVQDFRQDFVGSELIAVDPGGSIICIAAGKTIHIGIPHTDNPSKTLDNLSWQEIALDNKITCITCCRDTITAGDDTGTIRIYFDVTSAIMNGKTPTSSLLNWHQSPVTALQLSLIGTPCEATAYLRFLFVVERGRRRPIDFPDKYRKSTIHTASRSADHRHKPVKVRIPVFSIPIQQ